MEILKYAGYALASLGAVLLIGGCLYIALLLRIHAGDDDNEV